MQIAALLSVLRHPIGIPSNVVKTARLEAANIIESHLSNELPKTATPEYLTNINKIHIQKGLDNANLNASASAASAPKNHILEAKPAMAELPLDLLTDLLCPAYAEGCLKYERGSWRRGFKMSIMMSACLRHLTKFFYHNETYDLETLTTYGIKKHHLGAAIFCIISIYNDFKHHPANDDRIK